MVMLHKMPQHSQSRYTTNYKQHTVSLLTFVQYAYPISQWQQAVTNILNAVDTPNTLWPYRTLSGPFNRTIVGPNADTLYIWVAVDLSHEDLVLTIPNISDGRNWIWPFYDMSVLSETNNIEQKTD
jgi:hypothetical protein